MNFFSVNKKPAYSKQILCGLMITLFLLAMAPQTAWPGVCDGSNIAFCDDFENGEWNGLWTQDVYHDWHVSSSESSEGSYAAEVDGPAFNSALTSISIDLQGASEATVSFDWYIDSYLSAGQYIAFDASTDGGSNWEQKAILQGNVDAENTWHSVQQEFTDISSLRLRFRGYMVRAIEDAYVDAVLVTIPVVPVLPLAENPGNQSDDAGDEISLQLIINEPGVTFTATGLPNGLTISSTTGLISGTIASEAPSSSPFNVEVTATDGVRTEIVSFVWEISIPNWINPGDQSSLEGDNINLQVVHNVPNLTFSATGLPGGLTMESNTGLISGTIEAGASSSSPYDIEVTVGEQIYPWLWSWEHFNFNWTILEPLVENPGNQSAYEGDNINLQLVASEPDLTFEASGLPAGLDIDVGTGMIRGVVEDGAAELSPYVVSVTVSSATRTEIIVFDSTVSEPLWAPTFQEIQQLVAVDGEQFYGFGNVVSASDTTLAVSAIGNSVYVYEKSQNSPENWGFVTELAPLGNPTPQYFGSSLSVDEDLIVVGAYDYGYTTSESSTVWVFERDQGGTANWGQVAVLVASDGMSTDHFGGSVDVEGRTIVVGAPGANSSTGAAYVFQQDQGGVENWGQSAKIVASDGSEDDRFGMSVSVSNNSIIAGAGGDDDNGSSSGAAYVFEKDQGGIGNWGQISKLAANDGAAYDQFGTTIAMDGDSVVIGATGALLDGDILGAAYVFTRDTGGGSNWHQIAKLNPIAEQPGYFSFARSVAIDGDVVVVGAEDNSWLNSLAGSAYVFERNKGGSDNWGQTSELYASDAGYFGFFGMSVALNDSTILVGSDTESRWGSKAYVFSKSFMISNPSLLEAVESVPYSRYLYGVNCFGSCLWSVTNDSINQLPAGMSLDSESGEIYGTPTVGSAGTYDLVFELQDSNNPVQLATRTLTLQVRQPLAVNAFELPDGEIFVDYNQSVAITGGVSPYDISWGIASGAMPAGLSITSTETKLVISGKPSEPGIVTLNIEVSDAYGRPTNSYYDFGYGGLSDYEWMNLGYNGIPNTVYQEVTLLVRVPSQTYFVHTDHLGTPRRISDDMQTTVWKWDSTPFGENAANQDPDGNGVELEMNVRFPGQYFDVESGLHYNYFRDYDPSTGRYVESDPIGLDGGLNTYIYAENRPTVLIDPLGLKTYQCTKPLNAMGGSGAKSGPDIWGNPLYHQYSCIVRNGKVVCGGQDRGDNGAGKPSNDSMSAGQCEETQPDNDCFEKCLIDEWAKPRPRYGIPFGTDCQEYDDDVNSRCRKQCKIKK